MRRVLAVVIFAFAEMPLLEWPVASAECRQAELSLAGGADMTLIIRP